jgi:hypothetical protein
MKTTRMPITSAISCSAMLLVAQVSTPVPVKSPFAGMWEGKMNDLPAIELKIDEAARKISGTMIFYFQERDNPNKPWHVASLNPVPLLAPHVDGKTLTFEVQHHKCHTCAELGPNVKFRMEITGVDEARLWRFENEEQEKNKEPGPALKLVRRSKSSS